MSDDERAIRDLIATWMAASKAGDLDTVLNLMTDDVVFSVPGRTFGKPEFIAASAGMKNMRFEGTSEVLEVKVLGDWGWSRTHLTVRMTTPDGKENRRAGYTLSILQKGTDARWRVARDANMLAPEQPSA